MSGIPTESARNPSLAGGRASRGPEPVPVPTPRNSGDRRRQLSSALAAKGVGVAETTANKIKDEDLERALALVAGFDVSKGVGLLVHMLRAGDFGKPLAPAATRAARFWAKVTEMEALGFVGPRAQFAASSALMMEALKVEPTAERITARVDAQYGAPA